MVIYKWIFCNFKLKFIIISNKNDDSIKGDELNEDQESDLDLAIYNYSLIIKAAKKGKANRRPWKDVPADKMTALDIEQIHFEKAISDLELIVNAAAAYLELLIDKGIEDDHAAYLRGEGENTTYKQVSASAIYKDLHKRYNR